MMGLSLMIEKPPTGIMLMLVGGLFGALSRNRTCDTRLWGLVVRVVFGWFGLVLVGFWGVGEWSCGWYGL